MAEYAFNAMRAENSVCVPSSAGVDDKAQDTHEWVRTKLHMKDVPRESQLRRK